MGGVRRIVVVMALGLAACGGGSDDAAPDGPPPEPPPATLQQPSFVQLGEVRLPAGTAGDAAITLSRSDIEPFRRPIEAYDDPATSGHDGTGSSLRAFLACEVDEWSIGQQTFTVDAIAFGMWHDDPSMVERALVGVDEGLDREVGEDGVHLLDRDCDDEGPVPDYGGTHHTTQWLEALARAVHLLRSAPDAEQHADRIDAYTERVELLAERLMDPENTRQWRERWLVDDGGNIFTHKTYMRAAGLGLAATLTDDRDAAAMWAAEAERIAREGMAAQREDGVNPERGGHDVSYQMYGTWLAQLYHSTLPPGALRTELGEKIDRAVEWMAGRIDPETGEIDITGSTRTCSEADGNEPFEAQVTVRVFLHWGHVTGRAALVEQAVLVDDALRRPGANRCPSGG